MAYTRVDWEDLPSTDTPINATNLNNMDAGTKENDEILSGTKAINNTIYANDFVCKNMLNKYVWLNGYYMSNGSFNPINSSCTFDYIEVKPNTTYTISLASSVRYLGYYSFNSSKNYINGVFAENTNTYTFTTDANTYYIKVAFSYDDSTTITQSMIDGLTPQLELGSQATPYTPYIGIIKEQNGYVKQNSDIYANDFECKNLCNIDLVQIGKQWNGGSDANTATVFVPVKPSTTYTISYANSPFLDHYIIEKANISDTTAVVSAIGFTSPKTITTNANTNYLALSFYKSSGAIITSDFDNFQIQCELGSNATPYTPYKNFENEEIYSTNEIVIGKWIDERPLYRRVYTTTAPSSDTIIYLPSNVKALFISGMVLVSDNYRVPLNTFVSASDYITVYTDDQYNIVNCQCGSGYVNSPMHVCLEYIKTTD